MGQTGGADLVGVAVRPSVVYQRAQSVNGG